MKVLVQGKLDRFHPSLEGACKAQQLETVACSESDIMRIMRESHPDVLLAEFRWFLKHESSLRDIMDCDLPDTYLIISCPHDDVLARRQALQLGADAVFEFPLDPDCFIAQISAFDRRNRRRRQIPHEITIGDLHIDLDHQEVRHGKRRIELTYTQFKLLYVLASQRDNILSRSDILKRVWGDHAYVSDRTVDVHVKRLRQKLHGAESGTSHIETIHGQGYRFS